MHNPNIRFRPFHRQNRIVDSHCEWQSIGTTSTTHLLLAAGASEWGPALQIGCNSIEEILRRRAKYGTLVASTSTGSNWIGEWTPDDSWRNYFKRTKRPSTDMPWPPPTHNVANPSAFSFDSAAKRSSKVMSSRSPLAPSG